MLKKEKRNVITNETIVQYDRIALKNTNKPENWHMLSADRKCVYGAFRHYQIYTVFL